jgi:hypothetical protein
VHPGIVRTALHGDRAPAARDRAGGRARAIVALLLDPRHAATTGRYFDQRPRVGLRRTPSIARRKIGCGQSPRR